MAEQNEAQAQDAAPSEAAPPKKMLLIGATAGTFVVGLAAGMLVLGPMLSKSPQATAAETEAGAEKGGGGHEGDGAAAGSGTMHVIENMVLNPAQSNGARFLLIATAIEATDAAVVDEIKARDAQTRDVLISVLGSRTVEQLADLALRDTLRAEIVAALNGMLGRPKAVRRVYFPQFVVQ